MTIPTPARTATIAILLASSSLSPAQQAPPAQPAPIAPQPAFETPPAFKVSQFIAPELIKGEHHRIRELAQSDGYLIYYTVDSDFGVYECFGTRELKRCLTEIEAIAKLVEVSKSDLFAQGLKNSIPTPVAAVENIVDDPVGTVKEVPRTVGHFFSKVGKGVKRTGEKIEKRITGEDDDLPSPEKSLGTTAKNLIGFQKAKLDAAKQLHIDPYSDNQRLQDELDKVSWAFFAGGLPLKVGAAAISTGASVALTATTVVGVPQELYKLTPSELAARDAESLKFLGINERVVATIMANPQLSISARHRVINDLKVLPPGPARKDIADLLALSNAPHRARLLADITDMLVDRHRQQPYQSIRLSGRLPVGVRADGSVEVVAPLDYISWTQEVSDFATRDDLGTGSKRLISGASMSKQAKTGLEAAGWTLEKLKE